MAYAEENVKKTLQHNQSKETFAPYNQDACTPLW
jgi:hypothetical protein